jgi:hypothetical protein
MFQKLHCGVLVVHDVLLLNLKSTLDQSSRIFEILQRSQYVSLDKVHFIFFFVSRDCRLNVNFHTSLSSVQTHLICMALAPVDSCAISNSIPCKFAGYDAGYSNVRTSFAECAACACSHQSGALALCTAWHAWYCLHFGVQSGCCPCYLAADLLRLISYPVSHSCNISVISSTCVHTVII